MGNQKKKNIIFEKKNQLFKTKSCKEVLLNEYVYKLFNQISYKYVEITC